MHVGSRIRVLTEMEHVIPEHWRNSVIKKVGTVTKVYGPGGVVDASFPGEQCERVVYTLSGECILELVEKEDQFEHDY